MSIQRNPSRWWSDETAVQLIAAVAVSTDRVRAFDLLMGVGGAGQPIPEELEIEHLVPYLKYCRREELGLVSGAAMWLEAFPGLMEAIAADRSPGWDNLYDWLWRFALESATVLRLAYSFRALEDLEVDVALAERRREMQRSMADECALMTRAGEVDAAAVWTFPFPGNGAPARIIEAKAGLDARLKRRLAVDGLDPGLLFNYIRARRQSVEELFDPSQFEQLVAAMFRDEGWTVHVTPSSHDGGKDIVAERTGGDAPELVYVQAKRYRPGRAVSIAEVKELTATLAADNIERGFLVTTSHVSPHASRWVQSKGAKLAKIDFIEREELIARISALGEYRPGVFEVPE